MRSKLVAVALLPALLAAGCGEGEVAAPVACLEGPGPYLTALDEAPGEVRLEGGDPISSCLTEDQPGGEMATVGQSMLEATTRLNSEARAAPGGQANLRLGYLVGAAARGAEGTAGIHAELIRRLTAAARFHRGDGPPPPRFERAYRRGYEAGFERG